MPEPVLEQPTAPIPGTESGPQGEQPSKPTTAEGGENGGADKITPTDVSEDLNLTGLEKTDEGYTYKVGSSVYKGKNLQEVLENAGKGIEQKDEYIGKSRTKKVTDAAEKAVVDFGQPKERTTELPSEQQIQREELARHLQKYPNVDPKMLSWTDAHWDAFEAENEVKPWKMVELRQDVRAILKEARASAETRIDTVSVEALNREIIEDELASVTEIVTQSGIDTDDFDFKKVLTEAAKTQSSKGVFRSGKIVAEAVKEVNRILKESGTSPIAKQLAEDIARGKEKKDKIPSSGGTGAKERERGSKVAVDWDEAGRNATKEALAELSKR